MRRTAWGVLIVAILVTAAAWVLFAYNASLAQAPPVRSGPISPSGELIALSHDLGEGRQQVTLIDPKARVMAVYQIERSSGQITLKSVRNVHWDLQMEEFNGNSPSPRDLRALLDGR
jgi:hypothetical protein